MIELLGRPKGWYDIAHAEQKKNQHGCYHGELDYRHAAAVFEDALEICASNEIGADSLKAPYVANLRHQQPVPELMMFGSGSLLKISVDVSANQAPLVVPLPDVILVVVDNMLMSGIEGTGQK